jgi:hypothetical protein
MTSVRVSFKYWSNRWTQEHWSSAERQRTMDDEQGRAGGALMEGYGRLCARATWFGGWNAKWRDG